MTKLQAAIKYGEEDLAGAKSLVDQCPNDDPDTDINRGSDPGFVYTNFLWQFRESHFKLLFHCKALFTLCQLYF